MTTFTIQNFNDFCDELLSAGFSMGGNAEGIYAVVPFSWNAQMDFETPIRWHTEDPETDPWEWRIRVLDERDDIAYGKLFLNKSGYITREWYPYFLRARRDGKSFAELYEDGRLSNYAKRIYDLFNDAPVLALHEMKLLGGFGKEDKAKFDRAVTELQMKMFLAICGRHQKISAKGEGYSWPSTAFCTTERFFGPDVFEQADKLTQDEAVSAITDQILRLNPEAEDKKIKKFIAAL